MAAEATLSSRRSREVCVVRCRRDGGRSNHGAEAPRLPRVVRCRRNGGRSNLSDGGVMRTCVVRCRRNGGRSNIGIWPCPWRIRCEMPPKWRPKQLERFLQLYAKSCEMPPKWRPKQRLSRRGPSGTFVVRCRRNGGRSNLVRTSTLTAVVVRCCRNGSSSNAARLMSGLGLGNNC